jgi:hypothetical protein
MDAMNLNPKAVARAVSESKMAKYVVLALCALMILLMVFWLYTKSTLNQANCTSMDQLYPNTAKIHSFNPDNEDFQHNLRDYYIKTAYNACSAGQFKNDFVNVCALKNCIKQGARCLDFEIYSVDNKPVIATSSVDDFSVKETYNSVPVSDAFDIIRDYAFSGSTCPNPADPLIIHLRIMSNNQTIYNQMAKMLETTLSNRLLGPKYSYENHGKNLGAESIKNLRGKVILIVDRSNPLFEQTDLDEYVNLASNSIFMRGVRYSDGVKYTPDMDELIEFNKKCMTIVMPDLSGSDDNFAAALSIKCGCQFNAMSFQNFDANMEYYDMLFDSTGSAFILKPEALRFIPLTVAAPAPPNPEYSYKQRDTKTDYYSLTI